MAASKLPQPDPPDQPPCTMASLLRPIPIDPENADQAGGNPESSVPFCCYGGLRGGWGEGAGLHAKTFLQTLDAFCLAGRTGPPIKPMDRPHAQRERREAMKLQIVVD